MLLLQAFQNIRKKFWKKRRKIEMQKQKGIAGESWRSWRRAEVLAEWVRYLFVVKTERLS